MLPNRIVSEEITTGSHNKHSAMGSHIASCKNFMAQNSMADNVSSNKEIDCSGKIPAIFSTASQTFSKNSLPIENYGLRDTDVVIGRVKLFKNHIGNINLHHLVVSNAGEYAAGDTKMKSLFISAIAIEIRRNGRFVKFDPRAGKWINVGSCKAREKIAQEFRNVLHDRYRSSLKSKKKIQCYKKKGLEYNCIAKENTEKTASLEQKVVEKREVLIDNSTEDDTTNPFSLESSSLANDSVTIIDKNFDAEIKLINFDAYQIVLNSIDGMYFKIIPASFSLLDK